MRQANTAVQSPSDSRRAGLKTLYAALTAVALEPLKLPTAALPKALLSPAEFCILKLLGYIIGPVALKAFKTAGAMHHPLDEVIPGMPQLDATMPTPQALQSLLQALELFTQSTRLSPHFAYGVLNQQDYQAAHVMHIRQHLQQIQSL